LILPRSNEERKEIQLISVAILAACGKSLARPDEAAFGRKRDATTKRIAAKYAEEEQRSSRPKDASMARATFATGC